MSVELDPLLPVMFRPLAANNEARARIISEHAMQYRRDPAAFEALVLKMLQWSNAEAVAKDRANPSDSLQITQARAPLHRLSNPHRKDAVSDL